MSNPLLARTTDGHFEATKVLRETPTSTLYAGRHLRLGYGVAIKVPKGTGARAVARRELLALRHLQHPHNVRLLGATQLKDKDGRAPCLVLSLHHGKSLRQLLRVHRRLPAMRAIGVTRQILGALGEAHGQGIAHGDIQPANVLVASSMGTEDYVTVIDYGAAVSDEIRKIERGDQTIYGTPFYAAPELGAAGGPTVASDIYSVGILLHEMLSGSRPPAVDEQPLPSVRRATPARPPLRELLPGCDALAAVVDRATDPRRAERFPNAESFAQALAGLDQVELGEWLTEYCGAEAVIGADLDTVEIEASNGERYIDVDLARANEPAIQFPLLSTGKPTILVLSGDPVVERPEVQDALKSIRSEMQIEVLSPSERATRVNEMRESGSRVPWVVMFGPSHLNGPDPIIDWLGENPTEISKMLISDREDQASLTKAIDRFGLDQNTQLPAGVESIALNVRRMVERTRSLRLHYDDLRVGWRDASEDLQALTHEALSLTGSER